jgi:hypothetical protein
LELVKEGKILPASLDTIVDGMKMELEAGADEGARIKQGMTVPMSSR